MQDLITVTLQTNVADIITISTLILSVLFVVCASLKRRKDKAKAFVDLPIRPAVEKILTLLQNDQVPDLHKPGLTFTKITHGASVNIGYEFGDYKADATLIYNGTHIQLNQRESLLLYKCHAESYERGQIQKGAEAINAADKALTRIIAVANLRESFK